MEALDPWVPLLLFLVTSPFRGSADIDSKWSGFLRKNRWPWFRAYLKWEALSRVHLSVTPWSIASMGFSRPENWSGQLFPSPGDLPNPGTEPRSPALQADSSPAEPRGKPLFPAIEEAPHTHYCSPADLFKAAQLVEVPLGVRTPRRLWSSKTHFLDCQWTVCACLSCRSLLSSAKGPSPAWNYTE